MPDVISSKLSMATLSEKNAWKRYAEAKGDDWPEAFAKWWKHATHHWRHGPMKSVVDIADDLLIIRPAVTSKI